MEQVDGIAQAGMGGAQRFPCDGNLPESDRPHGPELAAAVVRPCRVRDSRQGRVAVYQMIINALWNLIPSSKTGTPAGRSRRGRWSRRGRLHPGGRPHRAHGREQAARPCLGRLQPRHAEGHQRRHALQLRRTAPPDRRLPPCRCVGAPLRRQERRRCRRGHCCNISDVSGGERGLGDPLGGVV